MVCSRAVSWSRWLQRRRDEPRPATRCIVSERCGEEKRRRGREEGNRKREEEKKRRREEEKKRRREEEARKGGTEKEKKITGAVIVNVCAMLFVQSGVSMCRVPPSVLSRTPSHAFALPSVSTCPYAPCTFISSTVHAARSTHAAASLPPPRNTVRSACRASPSTT